MEVRVGEIYGKRTEAKVLMYSVKNVSRKSIVLQNIDNPLSLFETTPEKLEHAGYERISQTPYVAAKPASRRRQAQSRPKRCPHTVDIFEGRADCEKPLYI